MTFTWYTKRKKQVYDAFRILKMKLTIKTYDIMNAESIRRDRKIGMLFDDMMLKIQKYLELLRVRLYFFKKKHIQVIIIVVLKLGKHIKHRNRKGEDEILERFDEY